jgi:hypothetical protein
MIRTTTVCLITELKKFEKFAIVSYHDKCLKIIHKIESINIDINDINTSLTDIQISIDKCREFVQNHKLKLSHLQFSIRCLENYLMNVGESSSEFHMYYNRLNKESLKTEEEKSNIISLYQSKYNQLRLLKSFTSLYMNYSQNNDTISKKKYEKDNNIREYQLIIHQKNQINRDKKKECTALQSEYYRIKTKYYKKFQKLKTLLIESTDIINDNDDIHYSSKLLSNIEVICNNPFFSPETDKLMDIILNLDNNIEFNMSETDSSSDNESVII